MMDLGMFTGLGEDRPAQQRIQQRLPQATSETAYGYS